MTPATRAKKAEPRIARLHHLPGGLVLGVTAGKDTVFYGLKPLDACFGQAAFRLEKAERGGVAGEVYDVLIDGARSSCECKGFLRWHHCKHLEAIESLIKAGKVAVRQVEKPAEPVQLCSLCHARPSVEGEDLCRDCLYPV